MPVPSDALGFAELRNDSVCDGVAGLGLSDWRPVKPWEPIWFSTMSMPGRTLPAASAGPADVALLETPRQSFGEGKLKSDEEPLTNFSPALKECAGAPTVLN